jgi:hypothetical protein
MTKPQLGAPGLRSPPELKIKKQQAQVHENVTLSAILEWSPCGAFALKISAVADC